MAVLRIAVVTGANKGIGLEICRQLACNGVLVVLTARDEKRGIAAVEKLNKSDFDEQVVFHPLDVTSSYSVASLADFIKTKFGKLDILVNNAALGGGIMDTDALKTLDVGVKLMQDPIKINWEAVLKVTYETSVACIATNYYGAKRMIDTFISLLQLSDSPKIVNVSSTASQLKHTSNEWAKGVFKDFDSLSEEKIEMVLDKLIKDLKENVLNSKRWAPSPSYAFSKIAMNGYSRMMTKKYPSICINCVCPGFVKTDMNYNTGNVTVEEGAKGSVRLALLPNGSPSGLFYAGNQVISFE